MGALLESYGPDGGCWASDQIKAIELCTTACTNGLANYGELFPEVGACGECQSDDHCAMSTDRPRCDAQQHACVACLADDDCDSGVCFSAERRCAECMSDSDCETELCDVDAMRCIECIYKYHCPDGFCDIDTNTCVACNVDDHCPDDQTCTDHMCV